MNHKRNTCCVILNFIIDFAIYFTIFLMLDLKITLFKYLIFWGLYFGYYLLDVLNFRAYFKMKDFLWCIFLNAFAFFLFYLGHREKRIFIAFLIYTVMEILINFLLHNYKKQNINTLIIDEGEYLNSICQILSHLDNYTYIGFCGNSSGLKDKSYLGTVNNLKFYVDKYDIGIIIFSKNRMLEEYADILLSMKLKGIKVIDYFTFLEEFEGKIDNDKINSVWVLMTENFCSCERGFEKRLKRIVDLTLAFLLFFLLAPLMFITYILVKFDIGIKYIFLNPVKILKNPAFFKQVRIGYRGQEFKIFKFRSMKVHDPNKYSKYASKTDDRITAVGHFIRKTRLDELPQIINVIRGDMSFVGPRPEWNELGREYEKGIKNYNLRYAVQPGITGWAQTMYTYGASMDDAKVKLGYDLYYVKNQSFLLDMIILFKTCKTVLFGKGM